MLNRIPKPGQKIKIAFPSLPTEFSGIVTEQISEDDKFMGLVNKATGESWLATVSIHSISTIRATLVGKDYYLAWDDFLFLHFDKETQERILTEYSKPEVQEAEKKHKRTYARKIARAFNKPASGAIHAV